MLTTDPARAKASDRPRRLAARLHLDWLFVLALATWVVASRIPYVNDFEYLGKDGPLYVRALALDKDYNVPMPGNIGYVLLGKLASFIAPDPLMAFLPVNIALTVVAVVFCYLFSTLIVPRILAVAATFAFSCSAIVWYHGGIIASYPVWLAVMPAIGWFGMR
jgi:hypothetical protein